MLPLLLALTRTHDSTLLIVTHDEALAQRADRVLELREGRLQQRPQQRERAAASGPEAV